MNCKPAVLADQMGITSHYVRQSTFYWKIKDFSKLKEKFKCFKSELSYYGEFKSAKDVIVSPVFSANSDDLKWSLVMFGVPSAQIHNRSLSLYFEFRSEDSRSFEVSLSLSVSVLKKGEDGSQKATNCFSIKKDEKSVIGTGCLKRPIFRYDYATIDSLLDESKGYLINDELHIFCEYELISIKEINKLFTFPKYNLQNQVTNLDMFKKQWLNQEFCDYELVAPCGRKLLAHKFILAARSPVFLAMLKSDMTEKRNNSVTIRDISYEALKEMLVFMYSGKIEKLDHKIINGVIAAAEKYQVDQLKNVCKEFLLKNLTANNAIVTLKLCKTYNLDDVKSYVDAFIELNAKQILCDNALLKLENKSDIYVREIQALVDRVQL